LFTYPTVGYNPSELPPIDVNERDQSPVSAEAGNMNPCSKTVTIRDLPSNCNAKIRMAHPVPLWLGKG
jgi:hypothetical protein